MDINIDLFKRYSPSKKKDFIAKLTDRELLHVSYETIERILKEVGTGDPEKRRNKFKMLKIGRRANNNMNSYIESIYNNGRKKTIMMDVYIQGDDIDTSEDFALKDFLNTRYDYITCATLTESFSNGYSHTVPANYYQEDRARVIREILLVYIRLKYEKNQ